MEAERPKQWKWNGVDDPVNHCLAGNSLAHGPAGHRKDAPGPDDCCREQGKAVRKTHCSAQNLWGWGRRRPTTGCAFTMRAWVNTIPQSVSGGIPNRSMRVMTWLEQLAVEESIVEGSHLGGLSLDLAKAFNTLPRVPLKKLMIAVGFGPNEAEIWFNSLDRMTRSLNIRGTFGQPVPSLLEYQKEIRSVVSRWPVCVSFSRIACIALGLFPQRLLTTGRSRQRPLTYSNLPSVWFRCLQRRGTSPLTIKRHGPGARPALCESAGKVSNHLQNIVADSAIELGVVRMYSKCPRPKAAQARLSKGVALCKRGA